MKKPLPKSAPASVAPHLGRIELLFTVFVTGSATLTIEILGTRIAGPVFGVSLFVWSALLAVTLGALAAGYYAGGVLVDRYTNARLLGVVVAASGVLLAVARVVSHAVLRASEVLGPRAGPLVTTAVLFGPTLIALGMVGPICVRLATDDLREAGRRVGAIYAVSTLGSLLGTLVVGFWIVPTFETDEILTGTSALLILVGAGSMAIRGRRAAIGLVIAPLLAAAVPKPTLPSGFEVLARAQSLLGLVEVIDDTNRGVRFLRADHSIIGAEFTLDHSPGFDFIHLLEAVRFIRPEAKNLLAIGLGIGSLPKILERRGIKSDVVEIDPAVVSLAREYFDFSVTGEVHIEDARTFLQHTDQRYDIVIHDTFSGGTTPEHLLSLEVLTRIRSLLRPGGVLALNVVGYWDGPKAASSWAIARTVKQAFANVRIFTDGPASAAEAELRNLVFFASDSPITFNIPDDANFDGTVCERVIRQFQSWEVHSPEDGPPITDAHNPLGRLQLPIAEEHFEAMNKLLPVDVWIH